MNWEELIGYFTIAEIECQSDSRFKARLLKEMLQDKVNCLLFEFATPVVQEFERVNAMFQTSSADPRALMTKLNRLYKSLKQWLYNEGGSKKKMLGKVTLDANLRQHVKTIWRMLKRSS